MRALLLSLLLAEAFAIRAQHAPPAVERWLSASAVPLHDTVRVACMIGTAHVIGLGEATHGQHEAFELKRHLTMALVRHHGFRTVAYEASASKARACNDYIQGRTSDARAAMRGFGMLIWDVEENMALLNDLRAWNATAPAGDQVRFIGFDAQDGGAVAERISELVNDSALASLVHELVDRSGPAMQQLFQGDRAAFDGLSAALDSLELDVLMRMLGNNTERTELHVRLVELRAFITMYGTPGGRDKAMAELLLLQIEPGDKCVAWAHNGHVKRSALDYLGTEELAMGGHLALALNNDYYALGFTFGAGGFQANAPDSTGRWGFKRYHHTAPAKGSLEEQLEATGLGDFAIDLRTADADTTVNRWLNTGHGQRWWGGYQVPDDCDERTHDASQLMPMTPANDFDGLVFFVRTTAAVPMDKSRILAPAH